MKSTIYSQVWQKGTIVNRSRVGSFVIVERIGEGGMGEVWKIHHLDWDIDMAVKYPRQQVLERSDDNQRGQSYNDHDMYERFRREAEAWIRIPAHPNI